MDKRSDLLLREYESLRVEIARLQDYRASIERLALTLIVLAWAWSVATVQEIPWMVARYLIWWIPVMVCVFVIIRILALKRGIRLCGDYLTLIYVEIYGSSEDLKALGWEVFLRKKTDQKGMFQGLTPTTLYLWYFLTLLSVAIAVGIYVVGIPERPFLWPFL